MTEPTPLLTSNNIESYSSDDFNELVEDGKTIQSWTLAH